MGSLADIFAEVRLDLTKQEEGRFRRKIANIDTKAEGAKVATRFGVGFNGAIGGIVSRSAGVFAAGFAAVQGVKVFGGFINDARESAKVGRLTAQVITSTGGAAKVTADQVGNLATAISNKTGADDEAIQSGQNLLLTFTNIRNGVGKGNDIFNQASQAATDMAAAMNGGEVTADGLKTSSIQLGKALNDPIKGVSALSKVGVSFTADQKKQIKTLVESGKTMEAQKIILGELGKEFGGAAAAAADPTTRLKTVAGNLSETIGGLLLPSVNKFVNFVTNTGIPGVQGLISAFQGEGVTSDGFVGFMERVGVAARGAFGFFKTDVLPRLREFGGFLGSDVIPRVKDFAGFLVANAVPAIRNLAASVTPLAQDVGGVLVGGFQKLLPILQSAGQFIAGTIVPAIVDFTKWLKDNSTVVGAVAVGIGTMVVAFKAYQLALTIGAIATKAFAAAQYLLKAAFAATGIGAVILLLVGLAAGLTYAYKKSETFRNIVNGAWNAIKETAQVVFSAVVGFVKGSIDWITTNFPKLVTIITTPFTVSQKAIGAAWDAIKTGVRVALKWIVDKVLAFGETILKGASKAFGWVPGLGDKLKSAATAFGEFRDDVNRKLDGINDEPVDIKVGLAYTQALGKATAKQKFATGGGVFGAGTATSDSIPALLSNGEHVITAKEVRGAGGHKALEAMRTMWSRGFANGGVVLRSLLPSQKRLGRLGSAISAGVDLASDKVAAGIAKQLLTAAVNPGLSGVLSFVRSQVGKPYLWGGVGPNGYDCSGLVSAAINTALGRRPYSRLGATGSMPWSMFASGPGAFEVGWFKGNPGHTAATVNGTNIESAGGVGVRMGKAARGARDKLFTNRAHVKGFATGGRIGRWLSQLVPTAHEQHLAHMAHVAHSGHVAHLAHLARQFSGGRGEGGFLGASSRLKGDPAFDLLSSRGNRFIGRAALRQLGIRNFDTGGRWQSGTLGVNLSGKTETVIPGDGQLDLSDRSLRKLAGLLTGLSITIDGRSLDTAVSRSALGGGH